MPYKDLRQFIKRLEEDGELVRVNVEVDPVYEVGAILKRLSDNGGGPALLFEKVKGHEVPLLCNLWGTTKRYAMCLETTVDKLPDTWMSRIDGGPIAPRMVKNAPCKENILLGDQVDLDKFPFPVWNEKDGGRYLTTHLIISKDPHTGIRNVATYRMMVQDKQTTGVNLPPFRHLVRHRNMYREMGKPIPIAVVIGAHPLAHMTAVTAFPYGVDELAMAGALQGEPLEVVKCETVDLEVPATAEIVIEGEIPLDDKLPEGPYGEFTGYYGSGIMDRSIFKINAITHRNNPICQGAYNGVPITEVHVVEATPLGIEILRQCRHLGLQKLNFATNGCHFGAVAQIKKIYDGQGKSVALGILSTPPGRWIKNLTIVDEDIDPFDLGAVNWAIQTRCNPETDVEILKAMPGVELDPSMPYSEQVGMVRVSKLIIDATQTVAQPFAEVCRPHPETLEKVNREWKKYGIPE